MAAASLGSHHKLATVRLICVRRALLQKQHFLCGQVDQEWTSRHGGHVDLVYSGAAIWQAEPQLINLTVQAMCQSASVTEGFDGQCRLLKCMYPLKSRKSGFLGLKVLSYIWRSCLVTDHD